MTVRRRRMDTNGVGYLRTSAGAFARERGWTLIEMVIVMSLIAILAGIALGSYQAAITRSKEAVLKENIFRLRSAIDQYYADKGQYPTILDDLASDGYLRSLPEDPFTGSADTWQTIMAEFDPRDPSAEPGIYDVRSGSAQVAIDGSNYADW